MRNSKEHTIKYGAALRLFPDISQNAAVHVQYVSVNEIRGAGRQEYRGAFKVVWLAPSGGGGFGYDELVKGVAASVALTFT